MDIPLAVRELKHLRRATPGGAFDVYSLSFQEGGALTKRVPKRAFSFTSSKSFWKPVELIGRNGCKAAWTCGPSDQVSDERRKRADGTEEGGNGGAVFGVFFFQVAQCRSGDVTSSPHPPLGLAMILSCLVDSRGSGRYPTGWPTHSDWAVIRQKQWGFHPGDDARLS